MCIQLCMSSYQSIHQPVRLYVNGSTSIRKLEVAHTIQNVHRLVWVYSIYSVQYIDYTICTSKLLIYKAKETASPRRWNQSSMAWRRRVTPCHPFIALKETWDMEDDYIEESSHDTLVRGDDHSYHALTPDV